jgi:hypothetical protein
LKLLIFGLGVCNGDGIRLCLESDQPQILCENEVGFMCVNGKLPWSWVLLLHAFNAQDSKLIVVIAQVGAVKICKPLL